MKVNPIARESLILTLLNDSYRRDKRIYSEYSTTELFLESKIDGSTSEKMVALKKRLNFADKQKRYYEDILKITRNIRCLSRNIPLDVWEDPELRRIKEQFCEKMLQIQAEIDAYQSDIMHNLRELENKIREDDRTLQVFSEEEHQDIKFFMEESSNIREKIAVVYEKAQATLSNAENIDIESLNRNIREINGIFLNQLKVSKQTLLYNRGIRRLEMTESMALSCRIFDIIIDDIDTYQNFCTQLKESLESKFLRLRDSYQKQGIILVDSENKVSDASDRMTWDSPTWEKTNWGHSTWGVTDSWKSR